MSALDLNDKQKEKVKEVLANQEKKIREALKKQQDELLKDLKSVLSEEQVKKLQGLLERTPPGRGGAVRGAGGPGALGGPGAGGPPRGPGGPPDDGGEPDFDE
jgi:hypothetical protein